VLCGAAPGHRAAALAGHEAALARIVAATPGITLAELQALLQRRPGLVPGLSTLHRTLDRLGLRHEKSPRAFEQDRPDVAVRRRCRRSWHSFMDPACFT
jgi:hypothetical protein